MKQVAYCAGAILLCVCIELHPSRLHNSLQRGEVMKCVYTEHSGKWGWGWGLGGKTAVIRCVWWRANYRPYKHNHVTTLSLPSTPYKQEKKIFVHSHKNI
jgi:hypothetical protein